MLKFLLLSQTIFLLLMSLPALAQEVITGEDGRKIIVYPDGTWEPFDKKSGNGDKAVFTPAEQELAQNIEELETAMAEEKRLSLRLIRKRIEVAGLEGEVTRLKSLDDISEQAMIDIGQKFERAKAQELSLVDSLDFAKKWTQLMESVTYLSRGFRQKTIENWLVQNGMVGKEIRQPVDHKAAQLEMVSDNKRGQPPMFIDLMMNPPAKPCDFVFAVADKNSGVERKDVQPEVLFSFTDRGIEEHFVKGDLITCTAHLTSMTGGIRVLNLQIAIASRQAPNLFGSLKYGEFIKLKGIDGTDIHLANSKADGGAWNNLLQAHVYRTQYNLGAREVKLLREIEIDTILIRWSKVQEEYQVFDVDLLRRQSNCLDNS